MICPKCESEYVSEITECPVCNETLISIEDFEKRLTNISDWIVVYITSDLIEATMLKDNLESGEIETVIVNEQSSSFPVPGDLSVIRISVKKQDAESASEIIKEILNK